MKHRTSNIARITAGLVVLMIGTLGISGCKPPKHWVVIHDNGHAVGQPWKSCQPDVDGDVVAYLPKCLVVHFGEKVGFRNYSVTDVEIRHFNTLDAPDPFTLAAGEKKVFKALSAAAALPYDIKSTMSHGGPEMIVQP